MMKKISMAVLVALALVALLAVPAFAFAAGPGRPPKPMPRSYYCPSQGYVLGMHASLKDSDPASAEYYVYVYISARAGDYINMEAYKVTSPILLGMLQSASHTSGGFVYISTKSPVKCDKYDVREVYAVSFYAPYEYYDDEEYDGYGMGKN